jgi:hypothetical protein
MSEPKRTEAMMQAILMNWVMNERAHIYTLPNSTVIFPWESDLISVTKSLYAHEYEIKISLADYKRDAHKESKHIMLQGFYGGVRPNYFWYATYDFDITPPDHAGWIKVMPGRHNPNVWIKKDAPRLTDVKLSDDKQRDIARLLSFRIANLYQRFLYYEATPGEIANVSMEKLEGEDA